MTLVYRIHAWLKSERGQNLVEYGLVVGLIAIALIAAVGAFRTEIGNLFGRLAAAIKGIAGPAGP